MNGFTFTKGEKHVLIRIAESEPTSALLTNLLQEYTSSHTGTNVLLNLEVIQTLNPEQVEVIETFFKQVRGSGVSFVIAGLDEELGHLLSNIEQTPTVTEAQDLVFMEEVERELGAHLDFEDEENE
jgi:anti-anti-sigma regulatory factor